MLSDIEIAQQCSLLPIREVAEQAGIREEELEYYGRYKAKISDAAIHRLRDCPDGKLILVTAVNPTPAGEGKTTTTVGLGQAMARTGRRAVIALREPSLGPVFGVKGGAAGGGYSQVLPMEDINLHFTGDMHAITSANNLLCAMIDNHLQQGNPLRIDPRRILFGRCLDMNDRALRHVVVGLGGKMNGVPREDSFQITVASEVMAILCLARDMADLKERLGRILIAYDVDGRPVTAGELGAPGAMAALLRDALKPNLVQTMEGTPALMHGGPFANIAHGCSSLIATRLGLKLGDYCITEAGFGSDLGGEKFLDIKCRLGGLTPSAVVLVATVRALKYNGGVDKADLARENTQALQQGLCNLGAHIDNMKQFGLPVVVALNRFGTDSEQEHALVRRYCAERGVACAMSEIYSKGGGGGVELADAVAAACEEPSEFKPVYDLSLPIKEKLNRLARRVYGADGVQYTAQAEKSMEQIEKLGGGCLPVCVAKTQYSLSDNPALLGRPEHYTLTVRDARLCAGAGFVVIYTGDIMTMPGLPKSPAAERISVDDQGQITGLF